MIQHQNSIGGSFLRVYCNVEIVPFSVISDPLCAFEWSLLPMPNFVVSHVTHLEKTGSLTYTDLANSDTVRIQYLKYSELLMLKSILSEKYLGFWKL